MTTTTDNDTETKENPVTTKRKTRTTKAKATTATKRPMSAEHKAALAEGRRQGKSVRLYLEALDANQPKRGRPRTVETIDKRLATINETIGDADPLTRVQLTQERMDLTAEREAMSDPVDLDAAEIEFVNVAKAYSERKGISYKAWRSAGVPAATLKAAGIARS